MGKMILRGFCKTSIALLLMLAVGFVSYKITYSYYSGKELKTDLKTEEAILNFIGSGEFQEVSKNIIYGMEEETGKVKYAILEIFNTKTNNLDYITIPTSAQITLSNETYQKLYANNAEVPQIIVLSQLHKHFEGNMVYQYGMAALQDVLKTEINYYTVISEGNFKSCYGKVSKDSNLRSWKKSYRKKLKSLDSREKLENYITECYQDITSNLTLKNKLKYLEYYKKINLDYVYFYQLLVEEENGSNTIIEEEAQEIVEEILRNPTYEKKQKTTKENIENVNKDLKIQILNSSKINGLASFYKTELEKKGYQFIEIGNYNGGVLEKTEMHAVTEEIADELKDYFKVDKIQVADSLGDQIQLQIILGIDAKQ